MEDISSNTLILTRSASKEWVRNLGVSTFSHGLAPVLPPICRYSRIQAVTLHGVTIYHSVDIASRPFG